MPRKTIEILHPLSDHTTTVDAEAAASIGLEPGERPDLGDYWLVMDRARALRQAEMPGTFEQMAAADRIRRKAEGHRYSRVAKFERIAAGALIVFGAMLMMGVLL